MVLILIRDLYAIRLEVLLLLLMIKLVGVVSVHIHLMLLVVELLKPVVLRVPGVERHFNAMLDTRG